MLHFLIIIIVLIPSTSATHEKINLETLNNYSEFLNFGEKKLNKLKKDSLENSIIKSKVDVLGEIFKTNIDTLKNVQKLELIFLIDASSSVGEANFQSELQFVKKLLSDITVDYNHTRVAIITYSSRVTTNIDQISEPRKENNKCFLLNKLLNQIEYTGGDTYTINAFQRAKEIFGNSRNESKKVLFLITDGFSNGGNPLSLAGDLKQNQVTIFTIGIQNGNYKELYDLASTPGEYYSYLLDSFQEFESLARRALHVDLKSGDYIPLGINSPCSELCDGGDCCDKNALCTCGTSTGHYSCICQPGYYGSGLVNSCLPCPAGTYSDGPNLCLPCPDIHHTTKPPANTIKSCKCKTGYQATKDNQCKILKCPKVSTPLHGYFVKKRDCGNVLNSACGVRCEVGYSLVGSSIRLCQSNGTWSGDEPSCQVKTCTRLTPPLFGSVSCQHSDLGVTYAENEENLPVDTVCTFKCQDGKTLIGSSERTCLPLARWDGLKASCKQFKCARLPIIKNGRIEPASCTLGKQPLGKKCKIICNDGFKIDGPATKSCTGSHGQWDSKFESTICKDVVPPSITCPPNITAFTQPKKKFGNVVWNQPHVSDNSDLEISVWMKPSVKQITAFKFQIGETKVTYFAQDAFHNRAKCSFFITIKDNEPPIIDECLDPPTFLTNEKGGANVTWTEPNIYDNSHHVNISRSHNFGFFPTGTTTVIYTATDRAGNINSCSINITIEEAKCEALIDPIFGNSQCSPRNNGMQCVITCQEGYAVPLAQPQDSSDSVNFMCHDSEAVWFSQEGLIFPECSVTEIPNEIEQNGTITLDSVIDTCNNSQVLTDIENDIKLTLKETTCGPNCTIKTETNCIEDDEEEEKTNIIKREVFEEVPHSNTSRRRSKKKRINVKFQVRAKYVNQTEDIEKINLVNHNGTIRLHKPKFICPLGFVLRKNRCVQCPKGTFHNATKNKCQSCPFGTYSDNLGQTECKQCPIHHSTRKLHSKKLDDCKEQCPPGTHARRKIIKQSRRHPNVIIERPSLRPYCRSCPIGTYQHNFSELICLQCPKGYTTVGLNSISIMQCIPTADEICTKSPNICNSGVCIPDNDFEYSCTCPDDYIGSHCEKKQSSCDSKPCFNGGICREEVTGVSCLCPRGFSGTYCEDHEEKCLLICLNNGTCHQNDINDYYCICPPGFGGDTCEIRLDYCNHNLCENDAVCAEEKSTFRCKCVNGFIGRRCNLLPCDYQPCEGNSICINIVEAHTTRSSYRCVCPEGYQGEACLDKIDYCSDVPCQNGGTCSSNTTTFTCLCPRFYYGRKCEFRRDSSYILHFQKFTTTDYVKLTGFNRNLTTITACLWMQTRDSFNYGTLLSYATKYYDNAFTLTDYTGLVLYINNRYVVTDILLNDGLWHHVCTSWDNSNGHYHVYIDAKEIKNGSGLATNTIIEGRGNMVIGQEQDVLGGRFSQSETYIGKIAHVDVWSKVLSLAEVTTHMNDCQDTIFGDIYGWPEIQEHIEGTLQIENSSFCARCEDPKPLYNGIIDIVDNVAYYECYEGFYLSNATYSQGRRCTKAAKWEGEHDPYCKKVYCGYPGYVRNGYLLGSNFHYLDTITYVCYEGHTLIGNNTLTCSKNGTWSADKPLCVGMQCTAFSKPENSKLTIISEHSYEDFIENQSTVDIGTQVEISCDENVFLQGENVITCTENGTWDYDPPLCLPPSSKSAKLFINCDFDRIPQAPENGYVVIETLYAVGNGSGDTIEYKCRNGYNLIGENSTTCIIDGYWTEPNISCVAIICADPKLKNMVPLHENKNESYYFGNMVKFDCVKGYKLFGDSTIRCLANGRWSRMKGKCSKKSCRKPTVNGATIIQGNSYLFEDQVTLICPSQKQYNLKCNQYGMWVGPKDDTC